MFPHKLATYVAVLVLFFAVNGTAKEVEWKIATLAPKGVGWATHFENLLFPAMDKAAAGELKIKIYWGGIMGDDEDYIKKMHIGQLHGMACSAQGIALAIPEMGVLSLPFMFNDWEEVNYIRRVMYPVFDSYAQSHGIKLLYWLDQDFDQVYSTRYRLDSPEAFRQGKFATWVGPMEQSVLKALGANVVPINVPEIPSAVRQGIIDSGIASSIWVIGTQCYTVFKYINPIKIRYSPAGMVISTDAWNELPEDKQKALLDSRANVLEEFCAISHRDFDKAVAAMVRYGVEKIEMDPAALSRMKEKCKPVWDEYAGDLYPKELLDEVIFQLERYRKMKR